MPLASILSLFQRGLCGLELMAMIPFLPLKSGFDKRGLMKSQRLVYLLVYSTLNNKVFLCYNKIFQYPLFHWMSDDGWICTKYFFL